MLKLVVLACLFLSCSALYDGICLPYSNYSQSEGYQNSYCQGAIEDGGKYDIWVIPDVTWNLVSNPQTCYDSWQDAGISDNAWNSGDCNNAVTNLCCWQILRECNEDHTAGLRVCQSACENVESTCDVNILTSDGGDYCDTYIFSDGEPCTGSASAISTSLMMVVIFFVIIFGMF